MGRYQPGHLDKTQPPPTQGGRSRRQTPSPRRVPAVRLLLLAAVLTGMAALGGTAARYWKAWSNDSLVTAESFYFTSRELNGGVHRVAAAQRARFTFHLRNYVVAEYPTASTISYTCAVEDSEGNPVPDVGWYHGGSEGDPAGTGILKGTFDGGSKGDRELTCSIPLSAFGADGKGTVTVTAAAQSPYAAALTATVTLSAGRGGVELVVTDPGEGSGAVSVALFDTGDTGGGDREGVLTWPGEDLELVPDPTWETPVGEDGAVTVPAGGAVSVVFLKKDATRIFTESDFDFTITPVSP